jgi:hypothetical protein
MALLGGVGNPLPGVGEGVGDADGVGLGEGVALGEGLGEGVGLAEGVGVGVGLVVLLTLNPTDCEKLRPVESHAFTTAVWLPIEAATEVFRLAAETWYTSTPSR